MWRVQPAQGHRIECAPTLGVRRLDRVPGRLLMEQRDVDRRIFFLIHNAGKSKCLSEEMSALCTVSLLGPEAVQAGKFLHQYATLWSGYLCNCLYIYVTMYLCVTYIFMYVSMYLICSFGSEG